MSTSHLPAPLFSSHAHLNAALPHSPPSNSPSTPFAVPLPTVLAFGAWLKNTACLLVGGRPVWSALHGDLSDPAVCEALVQSVQRLSRQAGAPVHAVAHDLHPDFFSTRLAIDLAEQWGVPAVAVQHHHAHIAAVVAEHGLSGPVIGLALDGVGLGTDGTAWGGELLWVDGAHWQRLGHLWPLALPGGDRAATEPWRMAASGLHALGRGAEIAPRFTPVVGEAMAMGVQRMLATDMNCPPASSAGRWFDAAAGALGLSVRQTHEAQAAMALEAAATRWLAAQPEAVLASVAVRTLPAPGAVEVAPGVVVDAQHRLDPRGLLATLLDTPADGVDAAAARFHLALADGLSAWAQQATRVHCTRQVCLGGGCFFNLILRTRVQANLEAAGLEVFWPNPQAQGCGDAGLALGQAWVAAQQRMQARTHTFPIQETEPCV